MSAIYMNNYRGFVDTHVNIENVNFLVGENSTGKTSFLRLVQLLSTAEFWFSLNFNCKGLEMGVYEDLTNSKQFSIGFYQNSFSTIPNKSVSRAFLLRFREKDGAPYLAKFDFATDFYNIRTTVKGDYLYYTYEPIEQNDLEIKTPKDVFETWLQVGSNSTQRKKKLGAGNVGNIPFALLISYLYNKITRSESIHEVEAAFMLFGSRNFKNFTSIAPVRAKPKKTYDNHNREYSPEGEHAPYVIHSLLSANDEDKEAIKYLNLFGEQSGLFDKIQIRKFMRSKFSPFSVEICLQGLTHKISNVGYGVSQVLPILTEILTEPERTWFSVQQPEVHLHPRAQAAIGELIFNLYSTRKKNFIIETHSDFIIDRFRIKLRKHREKINRDAQVLFFERTKEGNKVHHLLLDEDGNYPEEQPASFRQFFLREELALLGFDE